jgi:hypothetical protein
MKLLANCRHAANAPASRVLDKIMARAEASSYRSPNVGGTGVLPTPVYNMLKNLM